MNMNKLFFCILLIFSQIVPAGASMQIDFEKNLKDLIIVTDSTERVQGLSNASISFQNSHNNKSHFFYAHLEPQANGAAFAGFKVKRKLNLTGSNQVNIYVRRLTSENACFQIVFTTVDSDILGFSYKTDFVLHNAEQTVIKAELTNFNATKRGIPYPSAPKLDKAQITSVGIRVVGRAQPDLYQKGLYALKLKRIDFE